MDKVKDGNDYYNDELKRRAAANTTNGIETRFNSLIQLDIHTVGYGEWIQKNCLVSRNGFRLLPDLKEEITNEKAYELYLESLKSK